MGFAIAYTNWARGAVITCAQETPTAPASSLAEHSLSTQMVASTNAGVVIDIDLGLTREPQAIYLVGTNLTTAATRRVRCGDTYPPTTHDSSSGPVWDLSLPELAAPRYAAGEVLLWLPPVAWSGRYVRLELDDPGNPEPIRAAVAGVAPLWSPARSWGRGRRMPDTWQEGIVLRGHALPMVHLEDDEEHALRSLARSIQGNGRVLVIPSTTAPETWRSEVIWAHLAEVPDPVADLPSGWSVELSFLEVDT